MAALEKTGLGKEERAYLLLAVLLVLLTGALCFYLRPAADDFYYRTFFDRGLRGFWEETVKHYRTVTGRVLVHLILCPLLLADMLPFRVFNVLLICALCGLMAVLAAGPGEEGRLLPCFPAALGLFWLFGIGTLSDGVLWGAGSLNYLFPVFLALLYYRLLDRRLALGKSPAWLAPAALLCASTVEMTGLLVPVTAVYVSVARWEEGKKHPGALALNLLAALAGYLFLFTSGGVAARLADNAYGSVSLLMRLEINYALFDHMICGPEGIWVIVAAALCSAARALPGRLPRLLYLSAALAVLLTGTGLVYGGVPLAAISLAAFLLLCAYGVWAFRAGERVEPFCMLCVTLSLGVCLLSPVVGARMLLPTAVFLTLLTLRSFFRKDVSRRGLPLLLSGLTLLSAGLLVSYTLHFRANARVIDENTRAALAAGEGDAVTLCAVPDERYGGVTVPSEAAWPDAFRSHYRLGDGKLLYTDPTARPLEWEGKPLSGSAILRGGQAYVPVREAREILGAEVRWEYACAVVKTAERELYFHSGSRVANLGYGITPSLPLSDPVRSVNSTVYISLRDFQRLLGAAPTIVGS